MDQKKLTTIWRWVFILAIFASCHPADNEPLTTFEADNQGFLPPAYADCKHKTDANARKASFIRKFYADMEKWMRHDTFYLTRDTLYLYFVVTEKGIIRPDTLYPYPEDKYTAFMAFLHEKLLNYDTLLPAEQNGKPVNYAFIVPVVQPTVDDTVKKY